MRIALLLLALVAAALQASASDFTRETSFDSVDGFVAAAKTFQPSASKGDISALFTARERGQSDDPKTGRAVVAPAIGSAAALWSNDAHALVLVTAAPPTEATRSSIAVLFLLARKGGSWRVADVLRFEASGKEAEVSAELTAETGAGYHLGEEGDDPVITVTESHGGRGYSYRSSASYTFDGTKLKRLGLE